MLMLALSPAAASAGPHRDKGKLLFTTAGVIYADGTVDWLYIGQFDLFGTPFKCLGHRNVRFYRAKRGKPDPLVAADHTNFLGTALAIHRDVDLARLSGRYYAKVVRVRRKGIMCGGDRSNTVVVTTPQLHPVSSRSAAIAWAQDRALSP